MPNSLRNKIKHFCYKGYLSKSERDRLLNALDDVDRINSELNRVKTELEQQPKMQDCEHCIHTYGTLGCCDMVDNKWIYDCEFGKEQYKKEHESQPCEDTLDKIITQIEQARDKDKLCEYPYNRCIRIIEEYKEK